VSAKLNQFGLPYSRKCANLHTLQNLELISDKALEGKDVKDLLLNVGSGGGAAAPAAGGAAAAAGAGDAAAEAPKEEAKEEGKITSSCHVRLSLTFLLRKGRIGRRHGFRSLRLNSACERMASCSPSSNVCTEQQQAWQVRLWIVTTNYAGPTEIEINRWLQAPGVRARTCSKRQCNSRSSPSPSVSQQGPSHVILSLLQFSQLFITISAIS
jgi:60s Acidic ribosomal protein